MKIWKSFQVLVVFWLHGNARNTAQTNGERRLDNYLNQFLQEDALWFNGDNDFLGIEPRTRPMPYASSSWSVKRSHHHDDPHPDDHYRADHHRDDWFEDVGISSASEEGNDADELSSLSHHKGRRLRNSIPDIAQSSCPAHTEWRILHTAKDLNNTDVQVFQPEVGSGESLQWFYTVTCKNSALRSRRDCIGCCIGIDHNRFKSACRQKKSYVMAYIRKPRQRNFEWNWIQLDTSCNCAVTPKHDEF